MPLPFGATRLVCSESSEVCRRSVEGLSKCRSADLPRRVNSHSWMCKTRQGAPKRNCRGVGMSEFCKVSALQVSLVELGEAQWMWADMAEFRVVRSSHFLSLQGWNITFLIQQLLSHPNCDSYSGNRCRFCARQAMHLSLATASNLAAMLTAEVSRHDP